MDSGQDNSNVVDVLRPDSSSAIVLVCEHASHFIPPALDALGLSAEARLSHAVWDPGALGVALGMAQALDAALVASKVSRLVYDCNRPPEAPDAMRDKSELIEVPGNRNLSQAQRDARVRAYYTPFKAALSAELARHAAPIVITVHSFTPVYNGQARAVEIGVLHDADSRLADAILVQAETQQTAYRVARNEPYGPGDGVTHTLRAHALPKGLHNVMLEIRNDLIATPAGQDQMARVLAGWIAPALTALDALGGQRCTA